MDQLHAGIPAANANAASMQEFWTAFAVWRELILVVLRDRVGWGEGSGGELGLIDTWLDMEPDDERRPTAPVEAELRAILRKEKPATVSLELWLSLLQRGLERTEALGEGARFRVLEPSVQPAAFANPSEAVAELQRLNDAVRDPAARAEILLASWAFLMDRPASDGLQEFVRKQAKERGREVARRLDEAAVAPMWRAWLDALPAGKSPADGREALRLTLPSVLMHALFRRLTAGTNGLDPLPYPTDALFALNALQPRPTLLPEEARWWLKRAEAEIRRWAEAEGERLVPPPEEPLPADAGVPTGAPVAKDRRLPPTPVPHPLAFEVGLLQRETDVTPRQGDPDPLRRFSGFGLVLRREGRPWRCVNLARAAHIENERTGDQADNRLKVDDWGRSRLVVPLRIGYQNRMSEATLAYDNRPLAALGPEARLGGHSLRAGNTGAVKPAFRYTYLVPELPAGCLPSPTPTPTPAPAPSDPWAPIPSCVFGEVIEGALFAIPNSGVLPPGLAPDPANPAQLANRPPLDPPLTDSVRARAIPRDAVQRIAYLRRVAVGAPRLSAAATGGAAQTLQLPELGTRVYPRVRELFGESVPGSAERGGLVVLAPEGTGSSALSRFEFDVRRPATDLQTYLRWQMGGASPLAVDRRERIVERYHARLAANHEDVRQNREDRATRSLALDDPAVAKLGILVERFDEAKQEWSVTGRFDWEPKAGEPGELGHDDTTGTPDPLLSQARLDGKRRRIELVAARAGGADTFVGPVAAEAPIVIPVVEGRLYRLQLVCLVDDPARFDPVYDVGWNDDEPLQAALGTAALRVMSPWTLYIEVATSSWETAGVAVTPQRFWTGLYDALKADFQVDDPAGEAIPEEGTLRLHARLRIVDGPTTEPNRSAPLARFVHHAELLHQRWAWSGRSVEIDELVEAFGTHVAELGKTGRGWREAFFDPGHVVKWEASALGARRDVDHSAPAMANALGRVPASDPFPVRTWEHLLPFAADRGASYHRFALRVHHRYAGLYPALRDGHIVHKELPDHANPGANYLWRWHSFLVPCRPDRAPEPPSVRAVLPLTEWDTGTGRAAGTAAPLPKTSGLMVLVRGPAFQYGGLAERVHVQIAHVPHGNGQVLQSARDPALSARARLTPAAPDSDLAGSLELEGPLGHSFDPDDGPRKMVSASYLVAVPADVTGWDFLQLRFARSLRPELTLGGREAARKDTWRGGAVAGWAGGPWARVLPNARLVPLGAPVRDYALAVNGAELRTLRGGVAEDPSAAVVAGERRAIPVLLVTRWVRDVGGRLSEAYVGLYVQYARGVWRAMGGAAGTLTVDLGLRARLLTVMPGSAEHERGFATVLQNWTQETFWDHAFDPDDNLRGPARRTRIWITGISAPINSSGERPQCAT